MPYCGNMIKILISLFLIAQSSFYAFLQNKRSLGWRARYVTALEPIPLVLTVDHPLLNMTRKSQALSIPASLDVKPPAKISKRDKKLHKLLRFLHEGGMLDGSGVHKKKKQKCNAKTTGETIEILSSDDEKNGAEKAIQPYCELSNSHRDTGLGLLAWVEVLGRDNGSTKQSKLPSKPAAAMWIPIHPEQESFDKPEEVESILAWRQMKENVKSDETSTTKRGGKMSIKKKKLGMLKGLHPKNANTYAKKIPVSYVLAAEHFPLELVDWPHSNSKGTRFTDVTPRYANTWSRTLRLRGATGKEVTTGGGNCVDEWWEKSLKAINRHGRPKATQKSNKSTTKSKSPVRAVTKTKSSNGKEVDVVELESSDDEQNPGDSDSDEHETTEAKELSGNIEREKIPTSKSAFKQSPFYIIPSVLNSRDVLHPDARKRICGVFKGELVYRRSDVSKALQAKKWLYQGRKVKDTELDKPVKQVKARKKPVKKGFNALSTYGVSEEAQNDMISSINNSKGKREDGPEMDNLYGLWQTSPWSPPYVGPNDTIPTNQYKNVELALINPGLTHIDLPRLASIAKKLGIPYSPCMLGYEGHGGSGTPTIRGIVVHDHNVALLREAHVEWESHAIEKEQEDRRKEILKRWKRLVVGILTKDRLDREYG